MGKQQVGHVEFNAKVGIKSSKVLYLRSSQTVKYCELLKAELQDQEELILGLWLLLNSESVSLYLLFLFVPKKAAHRPSETFLLICVQSGSTQPQPQKSHGNSERQGVFYHISISYIPSMQCMFQRDTLPMLLNLILRKHQHLHTLFLYRCELYAD